MTVDPWLHRWLPLLVARAGGQPVLEIGCGTGEDTATLHRAGLQILAFDLSREAISSARARVPDATIECRDVRESFPAGARNLGVVVASLSLHYFPWVETVAIVSRIRDVLRPDGLLACRLNATDDHNHGASGYPQIEPGLYSVRGQQKRFFDEDSVLALFASGWRRVSVEHQIIHKYILAKAVWEVILEKDG